MVLSTNSSLEKKPEYANTNKAGKNKTNDKEWCWPER